MASLTPVPNANVKPPVVKPKLPPQMEYADATSAGTNPAGGNTTGSAPSGSNFSGPPPPDTSITMPNMPYAQMQNTATDLRPDYSQLAAPTVQGVQVNSQNSGYWTMDPAAQAANVDPAKLMQSGYWKMDPAAQSQDVTGNYQMPDSQFQTPEDILAAQGQSDAEYEQRQADWNRYNQQGVFGSQSFEGKTLVQKLSDEEAQKLALQQGKDIALGQLTGELAGGLGNLLSNPLDYSQFGDMPGSGDYTDFRANIEQKLMENFEAQNGAQFARQLEDFEQTMANRGIPAGSEQYNELKAQLMQQQSNARLAAQSEAIKLSGQEAQNTFGMAMQGRQQGATEMKDVRGTALSEMGAVQQLTGDVNMPDFYQPQNVDVERTDVNAAAQPFMQQKADLQRDQMGLSQENKQFNAGEANKVGQTQATLNTQVNLANAEAFNENALKDMEMRQETSMANLKDKNERARLEAQLNTQVNISNQDRATQASVHQATLDAQKNTQQAQLEYDAAVQRGDWEQAAFLQKQNLQTQRDLAKYQAEASMNTEYAKLGMEKAIAEGGWTQDQWKAETSAALEAYLMGEQISNDQWKLLTSIEHETNLQKMKGDQAMAQIKATHTGGGGGGGGTGGLTDGQVNQIAASY